MDVDDNNTDNRSVVSEQRRQRIYEMQFNRPYPKRRAKKKIQYWTESSLAVEGRSSPSPRVETFTFDRKWISSPRQSPASSSKAKTPSDPIREMAPRNLWAFDETGDIPIITKKETVPPTDRMEVTVPPTLMTPIRAKDAVMTTREMTPTKLTPTTTTTTEEEGMPTQVTPTNSSDGDTPTEIVSVNSSHDDLNVSPLSTPKSSLDASSRASKFLQMCGAAAGGCKTAMPSLDDNNSTNKEEESSPVHVFGQDAVHLESHQTLNLFMKENESDTLKLYIDDYQESTFDRIVESLYGNRTLKTLVVSRGDSMIGNYKTTLEMKCFWEAMRCLPHLETLMLFQLRQDVLMDLSVALQNHPTLTHVQLQLSEGTIHSPLLDALRTVPKLSHIQLEVHDSFDVGSLLTCPNLQDLRIMSSNKVKLESQRIQGLIARMGQHPTLQSLDLEPSMDMSSFVSLAQALHSNRVLQSLRVSVSGGNDGDGDDSIVVKELGQLVQINTTLTHLWNHAHESVHVSKEAMNNDVLEVLKNNDKIQHFKFFHEEAMFWVAKEQILKRNRDNHNNSSSNKANLASYFQKYWTCGSLTDINIGIQDRCASSCVKIKERNCDKETVWRFMKTPSAPP
jgi:hypothetical protein